MAIDSRKLAFATVLFLAACGTFSNPNSGEPSVSEVTGSDEEARCEIRGSHRQICHDPSSDFGDTVEELPFYRCFDGAACGIGRNGRCSWKMTPALIECLQNSELPPNRIPHADYHVHWDHPEKALPGIYSPYESLAYIDATGVTSGMLITNTYMAQKAPTMTTDELVDINRQYSEILTQHPRGSKYQILCGVSFQRADAVELASRCLSLPKVRGIKLRNFTVRLPEDLAKFDALATLANHRDALVLSHFGGFEDEPSEDPAGFEGMEDTQKIVAIMDRLPRATLVIAHSGFGSFIGRAECAWIGEHYRSNPGAVRNIYVETSDSFADYEDGKVRPDADVWVESWRGFGLDRVMFGSDYSFKAPWFDNPLKFLSTTTSLAPTEAAAIVRLTGERLALGR